MSLTFLSLRSASAVTLLLAVLLAPAPPARALVRVPMRGASSEVPPIATGSLIDEDDEDDEADAGDEGVDQEEADREIVKEFKRFFRKYKDPATRTEAVLVLADAEIAEVVEVLLPLLNLDEPPVVRAAIEVLGTFQTRPPVDRLLLALDETKDAAVRVGLLRACTTGRYLDAEEAILPLLKDKSWDVRRRAIEALAVTRHPDTPAAILPLCHDKEAAVRCAAMTGLADLRSELVLEPARAMLAHEVWQVRASAMHALGRVRHVESISPLIERMAVEEGRLVADIGLALAEVTGRDFGVRLDAWQQFWKTYEGRFEIPTDSELRRLREKQREIAESYDPSRTVNFLDVPTPSRSILFVVDVSGSMEQEIVERERYLDPAYASFQRLDIVKTELSRTIEGLEPYVRFNVVTFAAEVDAWKKKLVGANVLHKSSATTWIRKLEPIGGQSKEDLHEVGLYASANLDGGRTNTYAALMHALDADGTGKEKGKGWAVDVDTIFFLSDGRPSIGKYVDTDDILREVREANQLRRVVIHALAIGEFQKTFMQQLARENGGTFVDLGK